MTPLLISTLVFAVITGILAWLAIRGSHRQDVTDAILKGMAEPWDGVYDTCPCCGVMRPCSAHPEGVAVVR